MNAKISLQKLSGASSQLLRPISPSNIYSVILRQAKDLLHAEHGSVFLWHKRKWHRVYTTVPEEEQIHPRLRGFSYTVFKTGSPLLISRDEFIISHPEVKKTHVQSLILIPLCYNNQSVGVLTLQSKKKIKITKNQLEVLKVFGSLATLSIKKTQLYEESEEAIRMRDLFISLAAHELRTPLTTMSAYVQLLYKKLLAINFPQIQWIEELSLETSLIIKIVNELLNVDLIENGVFSYHMKPISLKALLQRSLRQFAVAFPLYEIRVEDNTTSQDKIIGDADKLLQLFSALLHNAAKFSSPNTFLTLKIKETNSLYTLQLIDRGIGIPKSDLKNIFKQFYKGSNNYKDGMGLGLFLSKRIIEKHRGSIKMNSEKNKGTCVTIVLPKANL